MPPIRFFLANADHPIDSNHPLWHQRLPDRNASLASDTGHEIRPMTYGRYFNAVADFCTSYAWDPLLSAIQKTLQRPVAVQEIIQLSVFLEKHGALYHPARLLVTTQDQAVSFVVNVAVSGAGRRTLPLEMDALKRLVDQRPFGWLPTVYSGVLEPTPMFLADWFDGYHEFHLTRSKKNTDLSILVWDGADEPNLLTESQSADLYRQASMILTACYDPVTTDQIYPWHHAAGDFVVRKKGHTMDVKLITVRRYAPMFMSASTPTDERALLDNLITFCIHLSICMRLDRLDGVSELVWAPESSMAAMIDGFFKGLDLTGRLSGFPDFFPSIFHGYFNQLPEGQLMEMAKHLAQSAFDRQGEERHIVDHHLKRHVRQIRHCIRNQTID
jgi:hypothetical protein